MNDERLFELLATHAGPAPVDDAFEDRLYSILQREMRQGRSSRPALLLVAALVAVLTITAAIAVGSGVIQPPWVNPTLIPTPRPTTALLPCGQSSSTPAASTSPEVLSWSPERASADWPGEMRPEPSGCTPFVTPATCAISMGPCRPGARTGLLYTDPLGDASPMALAFVDIVKGEFSVLGCYGSRPCVAFELAATLPRPLPSPGDDWIAYGIVADTTGDGRADMRWGIDNAAGGDELRIWQADLTTGRTDISPCCQDLLMDASFPGDAGPARGLIGPASSWNVFRFYVWASVIRDGAIVATDYAPDFGWLEWPNPP